jgi:hypothetical protein
LALDRDEWSASCPGHFSLGIYWIGGWVDPRADVGALKKKNFALPGVNPEPSIASAVAIPTELSRLLYKTRINKNKVVTNK